MTLKAVLDTRARRLWSQIEGTSTPPRPTGTLPRLNSEDYKKYQTYFNTRVQTLADDLASGNLTVQQWKNQMAREIERLHLTAGILGRGGLDAMSRDDLRRINRAVGSQLQYLDNWSWELRSDIRQGKVLSSGQIAARGRMYGGAANATMQDAALARAGIPELPARPGDGSTDCLTNCKCKWQIKKVGDGDWDCYWRLSPAEHCPTCLARAKAWKPLRIRGGVIQPFDSAGLFT